jgi:hypothetical protein
MQVNARVRSEACPERSRRVLAGSAAPALSGVEGSRRRLEIGRYDAAIAAQEGSQGCERFLRATPGQRCHSKACRVSGTGRVPDYSSAADAAPSTTSVYQGCSQETLAPLATVLLPLTRHFDGARPERRRRSRRRVTSKCAESCRAGGRDPSSLSLLRAGAAAPAAETAALRFQS